jgi:hypothetical protein
MSSRKTVLIRDVHVEYANLGRLLARIRSEERIQKVCNVVSLAEVKQA